MKGKTLLSLAIVLALVVSVMPLATVKAVTATMEIYFENGLHEITKAPCNNFTVTIKIENAPEFTQWIAELEWNPAVLELQHAQNPPTPNGTTSDITEGPFMGTFGGTVFLVKQVNLSPGHIKEISEGYLSGGPASGTGEVCYIKFHCKGVGDTSITLTRHLMINGLVMVPCDGVDGLVHQPPPPATSPEAVITTPANGALVPVCNDVLLDGSMSTGGFDTMPAPGEACPITDWKWEVDNGTILELHGAHQSFHCDGPGLVTITLTVTAPDPTPPSAPGYVPTDSMTISIMQVPPSLGAAIDVYTATNGKGPLGAYPFGWSDAYGPQQLVTVYAKVTYNDEPVEYKPVAFEMIMPNGVAADYRTAFTDASGIATTTFRIPWEGSNAELLFGDWSIVGSVSISEVTVMDTLKFRFGYIVSIGSITVAGSPLKKGEFMTIDVQLDSISMTSHNVFLTIVACDNCGVPIGIAGGNFVVAPEDGLASGYTITIPSWAFVGTGTIYANVFTGIPQYGGVPYCPEGTANFIILKT
jgi:hypothetical protein